MDSNALRTPPDNCDMENSARLDIGIHSPKVAFKFHVPKADLRNPKDIPKFVASFWSRKIHPELFEFRLKDLELNITTHGSNVREPIEVGRLISSNYNATQ